MNAASRPPAGDLLEDTDDRAPGHSRARDIIRRSAKLRDRKFRLIADLGVVFGSMPGNWIEQGESPYPYEREALAWVRKWFPQHEPWRAQRPADAASEVSQRPQKKRIAGDLPYNRFSLI